MSRRIGRVGLLTLLAALVTVALSPVTAHAAESQAMHRLYNRWTGEHLYTASAAERDSLEAVGWAYEGVGWAAPAEGDDVYRLYNPFVAGGDHHYTLDADERDALVSVGWSSEGTGWRSAPAGSGVPLFRQYNPYAVTGTHNYTADASERDALVEVGWRDEGIAWYGVNTSSGSQNTGDQQNPDDEPDRPDDPDQGETTSTHTVRFLDYGGEQLYAPQSVASGDKVSSPGRPHQSDRTFEGWYTQQVGGQEYDFSTPVTDDLTLYAHWSVYVYFENRYGASYVPAQKVVIGEKLTKPEDPVDQIWNDEFDCWCVDEACAQPFDFDTPIMQSITLYAKWTVLVPINVNTGIKGVHMDSFWAPEGETIDLPDPPENPDYEFVGWFYYPTSGGGPTRVDENTVVTSSWNGRTIHARWAWKQHYQYEAYYLDDRGNTWYTGTSRTMFVKTDNPSAATIRLKDTTSQDGGFSQVALQLTSFDDVTPLAWDTNCLKVPGGYLVSYAYYGEQRGATSFQVVEYADPDGSVSESSLAVDSVAVRTIDVNVIDGDEARQRWINETIDAYTTDSMTPPEKMRAICKGILSDFTYLTNFGEEGGRASLVTDPDSPFWVTHRWDSFISPAMLCEIAETIGGFTDITNHYGDYPAGSDGWISTHYYASMTYDGEEYWYEACPLSKTNEISRDDVEMVDFTDTSSMQPA